MDSETWDPALPYREYERLRRDLERRLAGVAAATWSTAALGGLLRALIRDLDLAWSGIEVLDTHIESSDAFVVLYRAVYVDGPLAIRGRKELRSGYVAGADTPQTFGGHFVLYLQEPCGPESFTPPDGNGVRWFINFGEGGQWFYPSSATLLR